MRAQIGAFLTVEQEWRPLALILALVQDVGDDGRPRERQLILRALETREQCLVPLLHGEMRHRHVKDGTGVIACAWPVVNGHAIKLSGRVGPEHVLRPVKRLFRIGERLVTEHHADARPLVDVAEIANLERRPALFIEPRWTAMQEATTRFQRFQRFHP